MCCGSGQVSYQPIDQSRTSPEELRDRALLEQINKSATVKRYSRLPPDYQSEFSTTARVKGVVIFVFVAVAITAFALLCSNHLTTFPHDFINMFTHVNTTSLLIGLGTTTILVLGMAWVIHRARKKEDPYVQNQIFRSSNFNDHIEEVMFEYSKNGRNFYGQAYIDKSTLDAEGNGKAYLYAVKDVGGHYMVSTLVPLVTPVYVVGTVVYHAIRMCIVPFYVLACLAIEACIGRPLIEGQRRFKAIDVIKEPGKSLLHIVKAPFYGLAYMAAGIYSLVNPMGGRILAAKIERDWNNGATRPEGFWSIGGPQGLWAGWGELGPDKLGEFKMFLAGCWQPLGVVEYQNGTIINGKSMSRVVEEGRGHEYHVFTASQLEEQITPLREEYNEILDRLNGGLT